MLNLGHRGASAQAPENTLRAFRLALAMGADGVELDVHRCKSGELVVIHDDTVERTTNGKGRVAEMALSELRALSINGIEHIPTLNEVLDVLVDAWCFIEIKHADAALLAAELMQQRLQKGWPPNRLWLISFKHEALVKAQKAYPPINTGHSFEKLTETSIAQSYDAGARAIIPHHQSFGAIQMAEAHALGLKVISWTVNEHTDIDRLKGLGVDGIISDHPDRVAYSAAGV